MNRPLPPNNDVTRYQEPAKPAPYAVYVEDEQELDLDVRSIWAFVRRNLWIILTGVLLAVS
ncbi:MAG: hypothetical protein R3324_05870, partial [Halobacteriales archaeon]|nr:hypothetical protein [Halobacteriales archaeon]